MINLIFPITKDTPENKKFFEETQKRKDVNFLVGVTEELKEKYKKSLSSKNLKVKVYKTGSNCEEIINAIKDYAKDGNIFIVRAPLTQKEVDKFVSSKADITYCSKKKDNKFVSFFKELGQKIIKTLFGFTPYKGHVRAVSFSESPSDILREGYNISYATRVDRWKGYSYAEIDVVEEDYRPIYNIKNVAWTLALWSFLLLAAIAGTVVYFCFLPATFLSVFVTICILFLFITALLIASAISLLKMNAGERYYNKAEEVVIEEEKKPKTKKKTTKKSTKAKTKTNKSKKESK